MWLSKLVTPGAAPGGLVWSTPQDVVEVDDGLGQELLVIGGFAEAPAPATADQVVDDQVVDMATPEVVEAPTAPRRGRPRKATDAEVSE